LGPGRHIPLVPLPLGAAGYAHKLTMETAGFTHAQKDETGRRKPQAIAHRGFKAKFPENTMGAFRGAVQVGADALETDIHLSKDGVVVLSHVSCGSRTT
jgi:tubulin gamma